MRYKKAGGWGSSVWVSILTHRTVSYVLMSNKVHEYVILLL